MVILIGLYGELTVRLAEWARVDHCSGWMRAAGSENFCEKGLMLIGELHIAHPLGDEAICLIKWEQQFLSPRRLQLDQAMTMTREISELLSELAHNALRAPVAA